MAREVALTELQQQRATLSADHSAQLDRISLHVRHEESQAQANLHETNMRLAATTASANDATARAAAALQANHNLEEQLLQARAAANSPERRYTQVMKANAIITETRKNFDQVRRQELEMEEEKKQFYYQEVLESKQAIQNSDARSIRERRDDIALIEKVKQLEIHLQNTNAERSIELSAAPKENAECAFMKKQIANYETAMADMAAQAEVDRQKYAHKLSQLQNDNAQRAESFQQPDAPRANLFEPRAVTPPPSIGKPPTQCLGRM